jgi:hypothetical protein
MALFLPRLCPCFKAIYPPILTNSFSTCPCFKVTWHPILTYSFILLILQSLNTLKFCSIISLHIYVLYEPIQACSPWGFPTISSQIYIDEVSHLYGTLSSFTCVLRAHITTNLKSEHLSVEFYFAVCTPAKYSFTAFMLLSQCRPRKLEDPFISWSLHTDSGSFVVR